MSTSDEGKTMYEILIAGKSVEEIDPNDTELIKAFTACQELFQKEREICGKDKDKIKFYIYDFTLFIYVSDVLKTKRVEAWEVRRTSVEPLLMV